MSNSDRRVTRQIAMGIRQSALKYSQLLSNKKLVLAISGGPDSLAMLLATQYVGSKIRQKVIAAHFSHGLRPIEDEIEKNLVKDVAKICGVRFVSGADNVAANESAAREARYNYLSKIAIENDAIAIMTAHTRDDQAETVLLRLARGSGLKGISAIREMSSQVFLGNKIFLLRPMLKATREQTEAACLENEIAPARDKSNESVNYSRNRVRLNVIPELIKINSQAQAALVSFAERAASDDEFLENFALSAVTEFEIRTPYKVEWDKRRLRALPEPLLIRVLENSWRYLTGEGSTLGSEKIRQIINVIKTSGHTDLGKKGQLVNVKGDKVAMMVSGK